MSIFYKIEILLQVALKYENAKFQFKFWIIAIGRKIDRILTYIKQSFVRKQCWIGWRYFACNPKVLSSNSDAGRAQRYLRPTVK